MARFLWGGGNLFGQPVETPPEPCDCNDPNLFKVNLHRAYSPPSNICVDKCVILEVEFNYNYVCPDANNFSVIWDMSPCMNQNFRVYHFIDYRNVPPCDQWASWGDPVNPTQIQPITHMELRPAGGYLFYRKWAFCPLDDTKCPDPVTLKWRVDLFCNHSGTEYLCCSKNFEVIVLYDGVDNIQDENILIGPNPSSYFLYIDYSRVNDIPSKYEIIDLKGKLIFTKDVNSNIERIEQINTSFYEKGIYLINFYNDKNKLVKTQKLIINKD